jgi:RNA recognition motif-containing protein
LSRTLYVGNLPLTVTQEQLEAKFGKCGAVISVYLAIDAITGSSKGFAYVEMASDAAAQTAIDRLNLADYEGRLMSVNKARAVVAR